MLWGRLGMALTLVAVTAGCLPPVSLQPIWTDEDDVPTPEILGEWVEEGNDSSRLMVELHSEGSGPKGADSRPTVYTVTSVDREDGTLWRFKARLVSLGGDLFWDLVVEPPETRPATDAFEHVIAAHLIARLRLEGDTLSLAVLREGWLGSQIEGRIEEIPMQKVDDRIVLTASTDELREFIAAHADDDKAFGQPDVYYRAAAP